MLTTWTCFNAAAHRAIKSEEKYASTCVACIGDLIDKVKELEAKLDRLEDGGDER